ncbi:MAG: phosphoribosylformylglycinamidine cyclo-ligase [Sphingomonadales bacterium]|nr:phosphoribosylformylglycinamidine cyclo-ligase [Sphingomonadales bacterium]
MSEYLRRGVSATKDEVHQATDRLDKGLYPRSFCKVLPDHLGGDPEWCSLIHADGAGSKSSLAYAYWKETGDLQVWRNIAVDAVVMNLDDMICVGCTGPFLLSSAIGRNARLIPGGVLEAIIGGTIDFIDKMRDFGIELIHGGGETADLGDLVRTVVVDATMTARMRRADVVTQERIQAGDVVVGLASFGQTVYESEYNSGMGSNGLTSARHDVFSHALAAAYPESYDPSMPDDLVYRGCMSLQDPVEGTTLNAGQLVLSPTRTYAPLLVPVLRERLIDIHGMVHCSGGGQSKALKFLGNHRVVKDNLFPVPPLFQMISRLSGSSEEELYRVFNMGHRMEVYLPQGEAGEFINRAEALGIEARRIGYVEDSRAPEVVLTTETGQQVVYRK